MDELPVSAALDVELEPFIDVLLDRIDHGAELNPAEVQAITGVEEAEYAMRRLAALLARITDLTLQRDAWRQRIDDWYDEETRRPSARAKFLNQVLEAWAIAERRLDPKAATQRLPSGEIGTVQPKTHTVVIDDEAAVLAWAAESLDGATYETVVRTQARPLVSELRKIVDIAVLEHGPVVESDGRGNERLIDDGVEHVALYGGERVPGVHVEIGATTAKVRPAPLP